MMVSLRTNCTYVFCPGELQEATVSRVASSNLKRMLMTFFMLSIM